MGFLGSYAAYFPILLLFSGIFVANWALLLFFLETKSPPCGCAASQLCGLPSFGCAAAQLCGRLCPAGGYFLFCSCFDARLAVARFALKADVLRAVARFALKADVFGLGPAGPFFFTVVCGLRPLSGHPPFGCAASQLCGHPPLRGRLLLAFRLL